MSSNTSNSYVGLRAFQGRLPLSGAVGLVLLLAPQSLRACAACYGQSDSPMAAGMNWGIMSLLGIIAFVLGGVAGFFIFLARRSAKMSVAIVEPVPTLKTSDAGAVLVDHANQLPAASLSARARFSRASALAYRRENCAQPARRQRQ